MNRLVAFWHTAVGKKIAMAVTGIIMVGFLVSHMISNTMIFINPQHLDDYGAFLRSFGPLLWVARIGLFVSVIIHIAAAWQLTMMARAARPARYAKHERRVNSYAARTMRWGGVLLLVFIVFHISHLTFGQFHPDFREGEVGHNLITAMQVTPIAIFYFIAMIALGMHFAHGIWSALQTIGMTHPSWDRTRYGTAIGLALLVAGGLASIPLAAMLGLLQ